MMFRTPLIAAVLLVAGCQAQDRAPAVDKAWVRLPAVAGNPGAAYFTLTAGSKPLTLVAVRAKFALRSELHESMAHGNMTSMAPVKDISVAPGAALAFAPGGKHVMLFDVAPQVKPGDKVPLSLEFVDGTKLETQAKVVAAGDPAP